MTVSAGIAKLERTARGADMTKNRAGFALRGASKPPGATGQNWEFQPAASWP